MPDLGTSTTAPDRRIDDRRIDAQPNGRRVTRRRTLPGGRTVVGALLITLAAIGVFATWLTATSAPTTDYVVLATTVAAGDELTADQLDRVAIDLPDDQAGRAFTDPNEVVGSIALAPMAAGDLLTRSAVRPPSEVPGRSLFSFELPAARALGGVFDPGDRVDIVATDDGRTGYVATDLEVIRGTVDGGTVTVTLAVDDPDVVLALGNAVDEATVHLVQSPTASGRDDLVVDDPFSDDPSSDESLSDDPGATGDDATTDASTATDDAPTPTPASSGTG